MQISRLHYLIYSHNNAHGEGSFFIVSALQTGNPDLGRLKNMAKAIGSVTGGAEIRTSSL